MLHVLPEYVILLTEKNIMIKINRQQPNNPQPNTQSIGVKAI
jgi:hypothetical protein